MGDAIRHTVHRCGDPTAAWAVLIHGAGLDASIWTPQVEAYRQRFNVLVPELRGHGGSPGLAGGSYSWEGVTRDVLDLLDLHGIRSAHFVGISLGCFVARTAADLAPERVRSLVLAGAIVRLPLSARFLVVAAHALKRLVPYLWLYRTYALILMPRPSHRSSRKAAGLRARSIGRTEFVRWLALTHPLPDLLGLFRKRDPEIPTLYVSGDQDYMFLPDVRAVAADHTSASLRVVEGCGHMCTWQRPEAFNRASLAFLDGV